MLTIKFSIQDEMLTEVIKDIDEFYGIILTRSYVSSFLKKHIEIAIDIRDSDFDTVCREDFIEALGLDLVRRPWPVMGDSKAVKKRFEKEFIKAAKKAKIVLEDEWGCSE